jgi:methionine-S-sulfoxide reductase
MKKISADFGCGMMRTFAKETFMRKVVLFVLGTLMFSSIGLCVEEKKEVPQTQEVEMPAYYKKATFCGGNFWYLEGPFEKLRGVKGVVTGYTGGKAKNPTHQEVTSGSSGHCQAIEVTYDPLEIAYEELLEYFWQNIDPTTDDHQFGDVGQQYRPEVFYHDEGQKRLAEKSKEELEKSGRFDKPIAVALSAFSVFYPAEEAHQDYYKKHPFQYKYDRFRSGRDRFLNKTWKEERIQ